VSLDPRTRTVPTGYDALGERFGAWGEPLEGDELSFVREPGHESEVGCLWVLARKP
jgi:hypothetical protein